MSTPRFNHVALSVPGTLLDDAGRAEIVGFYGDVFGWDEMPTMTTPGRQLVLQAYTYDQFVFLVADDDPMRCPRTDHVGMAVDTLDELRTFHERARARAAVDDRVEVSDEEVDDFGFLRLHNFYVGFLLPLTVEVQHWDWAEGASPVPT